MPEIPRGEEGRDFKIGQPATFIFHSTDRENPKGNMVTSMALPVKPEIGRVISESKSGDKYTIVGFTCDDQQPGEKKIYQLELEKS